MKALARSHMWWPGLDKDIEALAKSCLPCQSVKHAPAVAPLHPWVWPTKPWQRIHIDFAGPFMGKMFFIAVDAHSKWPEVYEMSSTNVVKTIAVLRHMFAAYGLPEQVVSDNGPQFSSTDFSEFMKSNGIKHIRCTPYHPSSNGAAERFVQTFKQAMKAGKHDGRSLQHRLENFLLTYRTAPHATTNQAPCTLFLQRNIRTRFDLLKPNLEKQVCQKQAEQVEQHDRHAKERHLFVGQNVMVKNLRPGPAWIPGIIIQQSGPVSFLVEVQDGLKWKRHIDHIRARGDDTSKIPNNDDLVEDKDFDFSLPTTAESTADNTEDDSTPDESSSASQNQSQAEPSSSRRYPVRNRHPPDRFM